MPHPPPIRAEHIGSLLRPSTLLEARDRHEAGEIDASALADLEDDAIREAVALQDSLDLPVVTDGEFRRGSYSDNFTTSGISGVEADFVGEGKWAYTDRHGLKDICRELLGVDISKQQQSSDWGAETLSEEQLSYAAADVLHLHALREKLEIMLEREGRGELAAACFEFLPARATLDLIGWPDEDIFAHS